MNIFSILAVNAPKDLWTILINWVLGAVGNYGWTILLVTLLVKLVLSPLDFWIKLSTKKQTLVQKKCAPQIAKLKKRFASSPEQLRIQTQSIYKREGLNMGTSCIVMLLNMILTSVIFISFFASLREVSAYQVINQYEKIEQSYEITFKTSAIDYSSDDSITAETYDTWVLDVEKANEFINQEGVDSNSDEYKNKLAFLETAEEITNFANKRGLDAALQTWKANKDTWLWVENIWVADATTPPLPTYSGLKSTAKNGGYGGYVEEHINEVVYTNISNHIGNNAERNKNGYFILPILIAALTFASQWIADLHNKLKNKKAQTLAKATDQVQGSMKAMKIIMPIIMAGFAFTSSASFGIYLLASTIATLVFGEVIAIFVNKLTKKKQEEVEEALAKEANRMIKKGKLQEN